MMNEGWGMGMGGYGGIGGLVVVLFVIGIGILVYRGLK